MKYEIDLNERYAFLAEGSIEPLYYDAENKKQKRTIITKHYLMHDVIKEHDGNTVIACACDEILCTSDSKQEIEQIAKESAEMSEQVKKKMEEQNKKAHHSTPLKKK